jgi:anti-anti-sigma regulatory factor
MGKANDMPKKKATEKNATVQLDEVVGITTIIDLHKQLVKAIDTSSQLTIDASKVERITSPGFQLLLSAEASAQAAEGQLTVAKPSDTFINTAKELGLHQKIEQWSDAS